MTKLALALDNMDVQYAKQLVTFFASREEEERPDVMKVGLELFLRGGVDLLGFIADCKKFEIFLDLKLHDIPNQMMGAFAAILDWDLVDYTTIHLSAGHEARERMADLSANTRVKVLGVTSLTSLSPYDLLEHGIDESSANIGGCRYVSTHAGGLREMLVTEIVDRHVLRMASWACRSGIKGIVCSAKYNAAVVRELEVSKTGYPTPEDWKPLSKHSYLTKPEDLFLVNPGIRLRDQSKDDQWDVVTPEFAARQRSGMIVVGRTITSAPDKVAATVEVKAQLKKASK